MRKEEIIELCEMQNVLDNRIITEKSIQWSAEDRFRNTLISLTVELAEFYNETRVFKVWSENQQPNTVKITDCTYCMGTGDMNAEANMEMLMEGQSGHPYEKCDSCGGTGKNEPTNPLLEEFVDCVHFFLSLANQKGWRDELIKNVGHYRKYGTRQSCNDEYLMIVGSLADLRFDSQSELQKIIKFSLAWESFLILGIVEFGFTWEQIVDAYKAKNEKNHVRQNTGY